MKTATAVQAIRCPIVELTDQNGKVVRTVQRDVPDHVSFIGTLTSGAVLTQAMRGGPTFMGGLGLTWHIKGTKAEIEATSGITFALSEENSLRIREQGSDTAENVELVDAAFATQLPYHARYVGGLYEAFAEGSQGQYPDWDWAVKRHQLLTTLKDSSDKGTRLAVQ